MGITKILRVMRVMHVMYVKARKRLRAFIRNTRAFIRNTHAFIRIAQIRKTICVNTPSRAMMNEKSAQCADFSRYRR